MKPFTAEEETRIRDALQKGSDPVCPRCGSTMESAPISTSRAVAYVRARIRATCHRCRVTVVVDRGRIQRE
jgi:hypothetical protein